MSSTPRRIALEILHATDKKGVRADQLLGRAFKNHPELTPREKAFITELVYGVLRWRNYIDWLISNFISSPYRSLSRLLFNLLRLGTYQVLYLTKVPVPVSVSETVEIAKQLFNQKMANLVNGILRNIENNRNNLPELSLKNDPVQTIAIQFSHPDWLVKRWIKQYGTETTISLCKANNTAPELIIRTNTLQLTREELINHLSRIGLSCEPTKYSSEGIKIYQPSDITQLSAFQKGWFLVQDEAAQLISYLLHPKPGDHILELCAAPGGKTTHLAQLMNNQGKLIAIDIKADNLKLLQENQSRLKISIIKPILADATSPLPFQKEKLFDKVLIDVPCSGLGILRRHPDGKWRKSEATLAKLIQTQKKILNNAAFYVKAGGILVYSTCTLNATENEIMIENFLSSTGNDFVVENPLSFLPPQFSPLITSQGYLQTFPHRDGMDGFFGARLRKRK